MVTTRAAAGALDDAAESAEVEVVLIEVDDGLMDVEVVEVVVTEEDWSETRTRHWDPSDLVRTVPAGNVDRLRS